MRRGRGDPRGRADRDREGLLHRRRSLGIARREGRRAGRRIRARRANAMASDRAARHPARSGTSRSRSSRRVNGVAAGLGAHLAWACDLVIAADDARFIEVFVRRGIALDAGGALPAAPPHRASQGEGARVLRRRPHGRGRGAPRPGEQGRARGGAREPSREWATRLAQGPTFAIGLSKRLLNRSLQSDMDTCFAEEAFTQALTSQQRGHARGDPLVHGEAPPGVQGTLSRRAGPTVHSIEPAIA